MMAKVYSFWADGLEEVEALTPVDVLRRAGDDVVTVSIMGRKEIRGAHNITVVADALFDDCDFSDGDAFVLPGGGEGTQNLAAHDGVKKLLTDKAAAGKQVAAICAAPSVLASLGLLHGKAAVIYPGMENALGDADVKQVPTVTAGNVTTGHGPGAAFDFALELVRVLNGADKAAAVKKELVFEHDSVI